MITSRELSLLAGDCFDGINEDLEGVGVVCLVLGELGTNRIGVCLTDGWEKPALVYLLRQIANQLDSQEPTTTDPRKEASNATL